MFSVIDGGKMDIQKYCLMENKLANMGKLYIYFNIHLFIYK